jgi:hypothetical protein
MNRAEYANAIRDLLALDIDAAALLPPDDSSAGFDNNADVLGVSPVLLESYLTAAERVSALALGDRDIPPAGEIYRVKQDESQDRHIPGLPIGTVGGLLINRTLPLDGEYQFRVTLFRTNLGTMRGLEYEHQLEISVDGQRVHLAGIRRRQRNQGVERQPDDNRGTPWTAVSPYAVPLKAGPHRICVRFVEKTHAFNTRRLQNYVRSSSDTIDFSGYPHIDEVILTGPFNATGAGQTPSRRRLFVCTPKARAEEISCARQIVATVARRAYRSDVSEKDIATLMDFFQQGRKGRGQLPERNRSRAAPRAGEPEVHLSDRARPRWARCGRNLPRLGCRPRFEVVVLPVEQHSGRRTARRGGRGTLSASAASERQVRRMLAIRNRSRSSTTSLASGFSCGT